MKIPTLESKSWIDWKYDFDLKHQGMKGKGGFTLEYVTNKTDRTISRENPPGLQADDINIKDS